ncbi:MAG: hypothetical protein ACTSWW_10145 [Promethearchaeota archaeon]
MKNTTEKDATLDFKFIDYNRVGSIVFMVLVIFLGFFGAICNYYGEEPIDASLIWYYQLFFQVTLSNTTMGLQLIPVLPVILIFIGFYLTQREEVSLKGIKISLYFVPLTTFFSILWYWINIEQISGAPFLLLFGSFEGYLTILITTVCILFGSYIGIKVKQYALLKRKLLKER